MKTKTNLPAIPDRGFPLQRYDAMCKAIAAASAVDEVKDIRDKALAIEVYTRQAKNTEAERQAIEIRLRAERRAGELLAEMEKAKGAAEPGTQRGTTRSPDVTASPTLRERGVSKKQSSDWQRLAAVPKDKFEAALADPERKPTTAGIVRLHPPPPEEGPVQSITSSADEEQPVRTNADFLETAREASARDLVMALANLGRVIEMRRRYADADRIAEMLVGIWPHKIRERELVLTALRFLDESGKELREALFSPPTAVQ